MCVANRPGPCNTLPGSSINVRESVCTCKRKTTKLFNYGDEDLNNSFVWTHKGCVCNEVVALKQRHQLDTGVRYDSEVDLAKYLKPLVKTLAPTTEDHIILRCAGGKRKLLISAKESLRHYPIEDEDGIVKMFLKADKGHVIYDDSYYLSPIVDYGAPRCIQYRNKRYCLRLATYLHQVEASVYKYEDQSNTPVFAKSRNLTQRGMDLRTKFETFNDPVILCIDHSKFDAHCNKRLLHLEHNFYKACFNRSDRQELKHLLSMQMSAKGCTKNSTKYRTIATRMSGDQNTGLGNSIINFALLSSFVEHHQLDACLYVDGDDSVIIFERRNVVLDHDFFTQFGMKTKFEQLTSEFREVDFCQTRPVFDGSVWRMVRNPARLLARLPWAVQNITVGCKHKYLRSIGLCEMALGVGLPIGQYLGETLSKMGEGYMVTGNHYLAMREHYRPSKVQLIEPSMEARMEYERTWGIPIAEQLRIERTRILKPELGDCLGFEEVPYRELIVQDEQKDKCLEAKPYTRTCATQS